MSNEIWYRYEDVQYAPSLDEYERPLGSGELRVHLREFEVLRHTPKGVWLWSPSGNRFVLSVSHKRFACATKEEAMQSFIARKKRQAGIYRSRMLRAEKVIEIVSGVFSKVFV